MFDAEIGLEFDQDHDLRSPIFGVCRSVFQTKQSVSGGRQLESIETVAPFLFGTRIFNVLVNAAGDGDGHDGVQPGRDEHDEQTQQDSGQ